MGIWAIALPFDILPIISTVSSALVHGLLTIYFLKMTLSENIKYEN
jgi:hypothetical protein